MVSFVKFIIIDLSLWTTHARGLSRKFCPRTAIYFRVYIICGHWAYGIPFEPSYKLTKLSIIAKSFATAREKVMRTKEAKYLSLMPDSGSRENYIEDFLIYILLTFYQNFYHYFWMNLFIKRIRKRCFEYLQFPLRILFEIIFSRHLKNSFLKYD